MKTTTSEIEIPVRWVRISIGIIYLWFGALKFFPDQSPAEQLAKETIGVLSCYSFPENMGFIVLACWEVLIGFCFIVRWCYKPVLILYFIHLVGTFTPLFIFRSVSFHDFPYGFTLVGQYIMKNIVLLGAGWLIWVYELRSSQNSKIS
jgi:uncharacterized membrane protein YkgB